MTVAVRLGATFTGIECIEIVQGVAHHPIRWDATRIIIVTSQGWINGVGMCYDPPQFFSSPSFTVTPSIPASSTTQPTVAPAAQPVAPATPAVRPPSPMQVDPANVPLPPTAEVTPAHSLQQLPSPPTIAICQPPLAISTQPSRRQYHAFYQSEPISPECAVLHQSLKTLFNVSLPYCPPSRATVPMAAISDNQSHREEARHSPPQSSIPSTRS